MLMTVKYVEGYYREEGKLLVFISRQTGQEALKSNCCRGILDRCQEDFSSGQRTYLEGYFDFGM